MLPGRCRMHDPQHLLIGTLPQLARKRLGSACVLSVPVVSRTGCCRVARSHCASRPLLGLAPLEIVPQGV